MDQGKSLDAATRKVVLVGGGHAHALVLRSWAKTPLPNAEITVINPSQTAPYTGMLPGFIAGHYSRDQLDYSLVELTKPANTKLVVGKATGIDRNTKTIAVEGHPPIEYNICSINVGVTSAIPDLPGFDRHRFGVNAKPLGPFATQWTSFVENCSSSPKVPDVCVIGGGVAGCELAMAMSYRLSQDGHRPVVNVIERQEALSEVNPGTRKKLAQTMNDLNIVIHEHANVESVLSDHLTLSTDGESVKRLPADFIVCAAGARPLPWLETIGLKLTNGFIDISETLQSTTDPDIFAVGDCAHMPFAPRPKAGVFAVRQAPFLKLNIEARLQDAELRPFSPQSDYLKLVSLGKRSAGAEKFGRFTSGSAMWRLKDRIDKKFMDSLG